MKFACPTCNMSLIADAKVVGKMVRCPGCNTTLEIPAEDPAAGNLPQTSPGRGGELKKRNAPARTAWKETDPTNPNGLVSFSIGMGLTLVWFAIVYPMQAPVGKASADFTGWETLANLFYKHFTISFANTLFFFWAMAICVLKFQKLKHQRAALMLDVLPMDLGKEINADNVGRFIDHLYQLPVRLRDSLMVNRIRKALEFFEVRQNVGEISSMMENQANIDSSRVGGSYILVRAFLWAIPLLGFIGTVVGLSGAIGGMSFANVEDVSKIVGSINAVTSGLGTAFDATLLGLVFAVFLNFPLNSLSKHEDEMLNELDAFCNEVLLPRLNDGAGAAGGDFNAVGEAVVRSISNVQSEFLTDLNALSVRLLDYTDNLDRRIEDHQGLVTREFVENMRKMRGEVEDVIQESLQLTKKTEDSQKVVIQQFTQNMSSMRSDVADVLKESLQLNKKTEEHQSLVIREFGETMKQLRSEMASMLEQSVALTKRTEEHQKAVMAEFAETMNQMRAKVEQTVGEPMRLTAQYITSMEAGLQGLNKVLGELGEKRIVVEVKKKSWFGRS